MIFHTIYPFVKRSLNAFPYIEVDLSVQIISLWLAEYKLVFFVQMFVSLSPHHLTAYLPSGNKLTCVLVTRRQNLIPRSDRSDTL